MEFDEHKEQEEEEEEDEEDEEGEIGIRLPATSTYESSRATKMATGGGSSCRYRECLKNHAVNIGGHAVDGCGEFMPAGEEGSLDALKCAACNCHRNFHRKEIAGEEGAIIMNTPIPTPTSFHHPPFFHRSNIPAGYLHMPPHLRPPPPLALPSTSGGGGQSREDQEDISNPSSGAGGGGSSSRKRFRTKFSQEQKDKMLAFAERLGWRIQKHDEASVQQFCTEICVKRHVLKVWMHNNKHTLELEEQKTKGKEEMVNWGRGGVESSSIVSFNLSL